MISNGLLVIDGVEYSEADTVRFRGFYFAKEIYRLSDRRWSAKLVSTFAGRRVSRG
jgi:hypothetical protein